MSTTVQQYALAVTLGVARPLSPVALPPLEQRPIPGLSPLEASGWAATGPDTVAPQPR